MKNLSRFALSKKILIVIKRSSLLPARMGEVTIKTKLTELIYTDKNENCDEGQGDQKIEKNPPIFQKVAQTVSKPKRTKI